MIKVLKISVLSFPNLLGRGNHTSCCSDKDCNFGEFRVYWRKWTSDRRQSHKNHRKEPSGSECDGVGELRKAGIEDWIAYLDGLESKVEIENLNSVSDDIKVLPFIQ